MNSIRFGAKFSVFGHDGIRHSQLDDCKTIIKKTAQAQNIPVSFHKDGDSRLYVFTGPDAAPFTAAKQDWDAKYYPGANPQKAAVHPFITEFIKPAETPISETMRPETHFETVHRNYELESGTPKFDLLTLAPIKPQQ